MLPFLRNVSGTAVRDRGAHILDYFQKTESDLTGSSSQRLGRRRVFPLGRTMSVIEGNSEVSALREFFAV